MDPMVGSGGKRIDAHNSVVGGVVPPEEENSNSNVVSLLEVCFLCNRRFLYDLALDDHGLKEEDVLLHMFFEDTSVLEKSLLLQCCTFCKFLCNSLLEAKSTLSNLIDEITCLLRKSKKLSTSASYMLSKPRVITRLFQEHSPSLSSSYNLAGSLGNLSSTIQIQLDSEFNNSSNSGFPTQFIQLNSNNGNTSSVRIGEKESSTTPPTCIPDEHNNDVPILKESSNLSFLSPSTSILDSKLKEEGSSGVVQENSNVKSISKPKTKATKWKKLVGKGTNTAFIAPSKNTVMVTNSAGRFVLIKEQISNLEENARDVEDSDDIPYNQRGAAGSSQKFILGIDASQDKGHIGGQESTISGFIMASEEGKTDSTELTANQNKPTNKIKSGGKFACTICPKSFKCNRDLQSHIGSHSQSKPFTCEICGTSYRQKKALDIHVGMHKGESKFECDHCKKVFTQKVSLLRHLPMHTGETVYQCDLCGKGFLHHSSFAHHKLTHSGKRNFQCRVCGQNFFTSSHLKRHYRTHTGEKPYVCDICDKSFNEKSNLKVHQRVHTKIPAFQCYECSKGFDRKNKLRAHIQTEHSQTLQVLQDDDLELSDFRSS